MELFIAGGCGDFGRSCFFVSGASHSYIVDCGTSTDGLDRVPDLTENQIRNAEYLFLTHSHQDHTGAVEYLEEMGFRGAVLMSGQTFQQIGYKPKGAMILDSTAPEVELSQNFSFRWGRSGHCAGSVWYLIACEGKTVFFSGDYRDGDPFYRCDPVCSLSADAAVIDAAYGGDLSGGVLRDRVVKRIFELFRAGHSVLLPVPKNGRGFSLAAALWERGGDGIPLFMSSRMFLDWQALSGNKYFCRPEIQNIPGSAIRCWDGRTVEEGIYLLPDAQMSAAGSRALADRYLHMAILFTGSPHGYGRSGELIEQGRGEFLRWPVHMSEGEMCALAAANHFAQVIPFHNPDRKPERTAYMI